MIISFMKLNIITILLFVLFISSNNVQAKPEACDIETNSEMLGTWSYINKSGEFVLKPRFKWVSDFSEGLAVIAGDKYKMGYIDKIGKIVIPDQFDEAALFSEGLAVVRVNDKCGFINKAGEYVINPQFVGAGDFSEGLAPIKVDGKWGYIDTTGKIIIQPQYDFAQSFSEGLACVRNSGKSGYIDKTGKVVIDFKFEIADNFSEGLSAVQFKRGGKAFFIDKTGNKAIRREFDYAEIFSEGLALVRVRKSKYLFVIFSILKGDNYSYMNDIGYIDKSGKTVIKHPVGSYGYSFSEGLARRDLKSDKWTFINKKGKKVFELNGDYIGNFSDGLARVRFLDR